jgi:hypothetical protein
MWKKVLRIQIMWITVLSRTESAMNEPLPENFLASELAKIVKQFEVRTGCSEGDSAANEVDAIWQSTEATRAVAEETGCSAWVGDHCEAEHRSLSDVLDRRPCSCRKAAERVLKNR